ncbi:MAG: glycosyltransferase [Deltaproteobacteria bacterium]|nr:glycosyltransferase [Deltaproteobacteria bacterium]
MKQAVKETLLGSRAGRYVYGRAQEAWFEHGYRKRREHYQALVAGDPRAFRLDAAVERVHRKLALRGYTPKLRRRGEVHTFAYVPSNWPHQNQIASALPPLGPCTRFDYAARGYELRLLRSREPGHRELRKRLFDELLGEIRRVHRETPIDWFFSYAVGWDMSADVLHAIRSEIGVPTVNLSLDDKNWWDEIERGDEAGALRHLAPHYDVAWTSARASVPWHWAEGGQGIFLPEGVNVDWFRPLDVPQDVSVGFVGNNFGWRPEIIDALRRAGIDVQVFGPAWPNARRLDDDEMLRFFNRCRINLGLGDMHYSRWLTNLKGRDFEIPATGRGLYLTTYNADLAGCFSIGREIECYRGVDELIDLVRHHLRNPEEASAMAARARQRCIESHQWVHRHETVLRHLRILGDADSPPPGGWKGPSAEGPPSEGWRGSE